MRWRPPVQVLRKEGLEPFENTGRILRHQTSALNTESLLLMGHE